MKYQDLVANRCRRNAAQTLTHYFRTIFGHAGIPWGSDNTVEIEGVVDDMIQAAVELTQKEPKR